MLATFEYSEYDDHHDLLNMLDIRYVLSWRYAEIHLKILASKYKLHSLFLNDELRLQAIHISANVSLKKKGKKTRVARTKIETKVLAVPSDRCCLARETLVLLC